MNITDRHPDTADPVLLEAVELELALQSAMPFADGCETAVREALAKFGGALLFHMRPDADDLDRSISAVFFGGGEEIKIGLVTISESERTVSVETVERSTSPLARIAPAYAAVLTHLHQAV